jgi:hypothetical protein
MVAASVLPLQYALTLNADTASPSHAKAPKPSYLAAFRDSTQFKSLPLSTRKELQSTIVLHPSTITKESPLWLRDAQPALQHELFSIVSSVASEASGPVCITEHHGAWRTVDKFHVHVRFSESADFVKHVDAHFVPTMPAADWHDKRKRDRSNRLDLWARDDCVAALEALAVIVGASVSGPSNVEPSAHAPSVDVALDEECSHVHFRLKDAMNEGSPQLVQAASTLWNAMADYATAHEFENYHIVLVFEPRGSATGQQQTSSNVHGHIMLAPQEMPLHAARVKQSVPQAALWTGRYCSIATTPGTPKCRIFT